MFLPSFWSAPCLRSTVASRCQGKDMTRQGAYHHFISPKPPDHFMWWEDTLEAFRQARIVNDSLYNATQQLLWHSNRAIGNQSIYIYIYNILGWQNCCWLQLLFFWGHETELPMYSAVAGRRLPLGSSSWRPCTVWSFYTSHGHPVHRSYFAPRYTLPAFTPCVRPRPERLVAHPRLSMLCWELSEVRKQDVSSGHMSYLDISWFCIWYHDMMMQHMCLIGVLYTYRVIFLIFLRAYQEYMHMIKIWNYVVGERERETPLTAQRAGSWEHGEHAM